MCTEQTPKSILVVTARRSRIGRLVEKPKKKDLRLINPTLPYPIRLVSLVHLYKKKRAVIPPDRLKFVYRCQMVIQRDVERRAVFHRVS